MEIQLNNQIKEVNAGFNLLQLVTESVGQRLNGIAIAINNEVIPKSQWESCFLKSNDNVLIIKAAQGG